MTGQAWKGAAGAAGGWQRGGARLGPGWGPAGQLAKPTLLSGRAAGHSSDRRSHRLISARATAGAKQ